MNRQVAAIIALLVLGMLFVPPGQSAPQPNEAQVTWEIDLQYKPPQPIQVKVPGQDKPQRFWYFLYTVTNQSGEDREFAPEVSLYTNTGQLIPAGRSVNPVVFETIKRLHNNPLLQDIVGVSGKLLQGEDNSKDGVAIFPDFDPQAASFTIFFGGLSGETAVVRLPAPIEVKKVGPGGKTETIRTDTVTLSKTLALTYNVGTEVSARDASDVRLVNKGWVMR